MIVCFRPLYKGILVCFFGFFLISYFFARLCLGDSTTIQWPVGCCKDRLWSSLTLFSFFFPYLIPAFMLLVRLRVRFKTSCAFNVKSNLHLTKGLNRIKENKSGELKSLSLQKSIKYSLHTLFNFSATIIMSDKMNQKTYECRQCHTLTIGYPALYRNQCLACRNLEIRNIIEKERYRRLSKQELV